MSPADNDRHARVRGHAALRLLAALALSGCTGAIGDRPASSDPPGEYVESCAAPRVVARRLSRTEYDNTVRDLFGFDVGQPSDSFPLDVAGVNGLTVSDRFLEEHEQAVERMAVLALERGFITCDPAGTSPEACARSLLAPFMRRAWRRPVSDDEVDGVLGYLDVVAAEPDEPEPFGRAIELAIQHVLMSPSFLFRFEPLADPTAPSAPLGPYELASRLSYFLWETMPDDALFTAAAAGTLTDPAELEAQVARMLADPRSGTLIERLSRQWLATERLDSLNPSATFYPDFDRALLERMETETTLFLGEFLREDRSFAEMFSADFTYVDGALARHYGLPDAGALGDEFTRVSLAGTAERGGLLTQGAVLAATSVPRNDPTAEVSETSIIVRGEFVLRHLLCQHLPPPPADLDVNQIQAEAQREIPDTAPRKVREGVRQSRTPCVNCHRYIDPIGFSMEHYDVTGAWRTTDTHDTAVDATGVLLGADGEPAGEFDGARSLGELLAADPRVASCLTENVLRLALGSPSDGDRCQVEDVAGRAHAGRSGLRSLVHAIIESEAFTHRRGEAP